MPSPKTKTFQWWYVVISGFLLIINSNENAQSQDKDLPMAIEMTEFFRIGEETQMDEILFAFISDVDINSKGDIFVADAGVPAIYWLSNTGDLRGHIYGRGAGPGEFVSLDGLFVGPNDSIFVFDSELLRVSVYEPETHQFAYSVIVEGDAFHNPLELVGTTENGFLIVFTPVYSTHELEGLSLNADRFATVDLVNRQGVIIGEIARLPEKETIVTLYDGGGFSVQALPFGRKYHYRVDKNGLLYSGWDDTIDIAVTTSTGQVERIIHKNHHAIPVTKKEIDELLSKISSRERRKRIKNANIPEVKPAYQIFVVDDKGRVWIKNSTTAGAPTTNWNILDKKGVFVAESILPNNIDLWAVRGNRAYGSGTNSSGESFLIVYSINE